MSLELYVLFVFSKLVLYTNADVMYLVFNYEAFV